MKYTLKPTITEKRIVERRYKAWQECECDNGSVPTVHTDYYGEPIDGPCGQCDGQGGWWHPRVEEMGLHKMQHPNAVAKECPLCVTKSSTLVHSGSPCKRCDGKGSLFPTREICKNCHGSSIEGEGKWEVEG